MKKLISLTLILMLILSMRATVLAANVETNNGTASQNVSAVYSAGDAGSAVISVEIEWKDMSFTYKGASQPEWDVSSHSYSGTAVEAGWEQSNATITLTNHSNVIIQTDISYGAAASFPDTSMSFTAGSPYIGSAYTANEGEGTPCSVTIHAIPGGTIPESTTQRSTIGSITVKVTSAFTEGNPAEAALEELDTLYRQTLQTGFDAASLSRGAVYFTSQEVANTISAALLNAEEIIYGDADEPQRNAALNEAITTLYSALTIKQ